MLYDEGGPAFASGQKVMIATTSYGDPDFTYTYAISRSREALADAGIQSAYLLLQGYCHVDDARNAVVRTFLESDCTELLFIDADVSWEPDGIVQLCGRDLDIVGGVYPYRRASENMPMRLMDGRLPDEEGMLEVEGLPTGFMKIKRHVLETLAQRSQIYFDKTEATPQIFERLTQADHSRWGGDIAFCNKWRAAGGTVFADTELRLGHAAKIIYRDSLAAFLRRHSGRTLAHLIPKIRAETEKFTDYDELFQYEGNDFAADAGVLAMCVGIARKCRGPIIETGCGLSSLVMAAANPEQEVYSLEHLDFYAAKTRALSEEAGTRNLYVLCVPSDDFWYDLKKAAIPHRKFAFGFCDGPPRLLGTRMRFFEEIAPYCSVIAADDIGTDYKYAGKVRDWAEANGRAMTLLGRAALLTKEPLITEQPREAPIAAQAGPDFAGLPSRSALPTVSADVAKVLEKYKDGWNDWTFQKLP